MFVNHSTCAQLGNECFFAASCLQSLNALNAVLNCIYAAHKYPLPSNNIVAAHSDHLCGCERAVEFAARALSSNKFLIPELSSSSLQTPPSTAYIYYIQKAETVSVSVRRRFTFIAYFGICNVHGDLNAVSQPVNNFNLYGSQTAIRHSALLQYYSGSPCFLTCAR